MTETAPQGLSVPALEKGIDVLVFLAEQDAPVSLQEIAKHLRKSRGELYRMVAWLVDQRYVWRHEGIDAYVLGERMGLFFRRQPLVENIFAKIVPVMTKLGETTGFSSHLSIRAQDHCVVVAAAEAPGVYNLMAKVGSVVPLWESAAGACIVHDLPAGEQKALKERAATASWSKFGEEQESFRQNGFVERHGIAGPAILELAFTIETNSRLRSAVTLSKASGSPDASSLVMSRLRSIPGSSVAAIHAAVL